MIDKIKSKISQIVSKKNVVITSRGNSAIKMALSIGKSKGFNTVLIQDQGGWMTYEPFSEKIGLKVIKLETDDGIVNPDSLISDSILIMHSLPAYSFEQNMKEIADVCKEKNIFLINDCTGSIMTESCTFGDVTLSSMKKDKPINSIGGGFIAADFEIKEDDYKELDFEEIFEKINELETRLSFLKNKAKEIKFDLKEEKIIKPEHKGINVIVEFQNEEEKEKITEYCEKNNLEFTECPRYIRVLKKAISIEVKRLNI